MRTTIAGLRGIDPSIREAGVAMGMTPGELLRQVELPLALPSIVAGVRVAAVVGVGSATIAAAIGAGGLGEYIYRGLSMVDTTVILAGAVPAAALALVVDGSLLWLERQLSARRRSRSRRAGSRGCRRRLPRAGRGRPSRHARNAARSSSGRRTSRSSSCSASCWRRPSSARGVPVDRRLNLGGTLICDRALLTGDIDVYVEYTGTALTAVFHQPVSTNAGAVFDNVRDALREDGTHAAAAARLQQHLRDPGSRRGRAIARAEDDRRRRARIAAPGAPASATSSSSVRTATRGLRKRTDCGFRTRLA